MKLLEPKSPVEDKLYIIDLTTDLKAGGDYITSATLVSTGGTVAFTNQAFTGKIFSAVFTGGVDAETSTFDLTVGTAGNQSLLTKITLPVLTAGQQPYTSSMKGALVSYAYEEAILAGYEFDVSDPEKAAALRRLDALMAEWKISGKDVGYNQPATMGGSLMTDPSGVPDLAFQGVGLTLALRLFPTLGKSMSAETRGALASSMSAIMAWCARIPNRRLPTGTVRGAGNRWRQFSPFMQAQPLYAEQAGAVSAGGDDTANISDMVEIFEESAAV